MTLITKTQAESWAGRKLSSADLERLQHCIVHSSIPDAIETIVSSWDDYEEDVKK